MRVWHSPWSWLNEIVPLDSVAGNTLIGMFTRLIFRNPFQVARAAIALPLSVPTCAGLKTVPLRFVALVVGAEIQSGAREVDGVLADLVPQEPPRGAVFVARHDETPCKIAQP